jgi:hypothetical protein
MGKIEGDAKSLQPYDIFFHILIDSLCSFLPPQTTKRNENQITIYENMRKSSFTLQFPYRS